MFKTFCLTWFYLRKNIPPASFSTVWHFDESTSVSFFFYIYTYIYIIVKKLGKTPSRHYRYYQRLLKRETQRASIGIRRKIVFVRLPCFRKSDFSQDSNSFMKLRRDICIISTPVCIIITSRGYGGHRGWNKILWSNTLSY